MNRIYLYLIPALALLMISCAGNSKTNYNALIANTWSLESVLSDDSSSLDVVPKGITLSFSDSSQVNGNGGCNRFFGTFSTVGKDQITIQIVGRTMAMCPDIEFEDRFISILHDATTYYAADGKLQLNNLENGITLLFKTNK